MDTSIGKALIMIAGVLLAMLVIGFVTQTFNQTSQWASSEDQEKMIEQVQKFNKEWEVYDKDLMYGVDVISCLNKALSNNDNINREIVKNGEKYDDSYEIKVDINLKNKTLKQTITVYYWKYDDKLNKVVEVNEGNPDINLLFNSVPNFKVLNNNDYMTEFADFEATDKMKSKSEEKEISLYIDKEKSKPGSDIYTLLSFSNVISENIKNNSVDAKYALLKKYSSNDYNSENGWNKLWTKLEFKSYLYDLKTRKFKCTGITYKADSGRVEKITFTEV